MTEDDIIDMARKARLAEPYHPFNPWGASQEALERFARLVAAHEREACALVCESTITPNIDWWNDACQSCADDIRARGEV